MKGKETNPKTIRESIIEYVNNLPDEFKGYKIIPAKDFRGTEFLKDGKPAKFKSSSYLRIVIRSMGYTTHKNSIGGLLICKKKK